MAPKKQSDPGGPAATTIGSGTGQNQVPYMIPVASGQGKGFQVHALLKEFNRRAEQLAYEHCLANGCLPRYTPAGKEHIKYERRDWGGWTELTMVQASRRPDVWLAQPQVLPANTVKRGAYVDPPSPNVVCLKPPVPPRPKQVDKPPVPKPASPPPPEPPGQPPVRRDCAQPTWRKPAGEVVIEKRFPFGPQISGEANELLIKYVTEPLPGSNATQLEEDIRAKLQAWINEVQSECDRLNPGGHCEAYLDPDPLLDGLTTVSGDSGVGAQTWIEYKRVLKSEIQGKCR